MALAMSSHGASRFCVERSSQGHALGLGFAAFARDTLAIALARAAPPVVAVQSLFSNSGMAGSP
jgi:hypothetical protein